MAAAAVPELAAWSRLQAGWAEALERAVSLGSEALLGEVAPMDWVVSLEWVATLELAERSGLGATEVRSPWMLA